MDPLFYKYTSLTMMIQLTVTVIEGLYLTKKGWYDWSGFWVSNADHILRNLIKSLGVLGVGVPVLDFASRHQIGLITLDAGFSSFLILFLGQEFCYYWYHRAYHRIRLFWANHRVHHTPMQMNFASGFRHGLTLKILGPGIFYAPLIWLGLPSEAVFYTLILNFNYQYWTHTTVFPKLGLAEYIFNTPSSHRVHHASNVEYLDSNFGGVLIIFDRLFGTYTEERDDLKPVYGLPYEKCTNNFFNIQFGEWSSLLKDLWRTRDPRFLFMPPGWNPNGPGNTTEELRQRLNKLIP